MYLFLHQVNPLILDLPYIGYSSLYLYPCDNFTESSKGLLVWLKKFSLIWRRHQFRWRTAYFDLYLALTAIEQWGFFSVPHLLWHGTSVYNGHLREPVTLTTNAESLAVVFSLPVFKTIKTKCLPWKVNFDFHFTKNHAVVSDASGNNHIKAKR